MLQLLKRKMSYSYSNEIHIYLIIFKLYFLVNALMYKMEQGLATEFQL